MQELSVHADEAWGGLPKSNAILISAGLYFLAQGGCREPKSCFALDGSERGENGGRQGQEKCCQTATTLARAPAQGPDLPELVPLQGLPHLQLRCPTSAVGHSSPCPGEGTGSPARLPASCLGHPGSLPPPAWEPPTRLSSTAASLPPALVPCAGYQNCCWGVLSRPKTQRDDEPHFSTSLHPCVKETTPIAGRGD